MCGGQRQRKFVCCSRVEFFFVIGFGFFSAELGAKIGVHALSNPRILAFSVYLNFWLLLWEKG